MKKRIVFVIESLDLGGAEKSLVTLLNNLDETKFKIDLITFKEEGIFREFLPKHVNCIALTFPKFSLVDRINFFVHRKLKSKYHNAQLFWSVAKNKFKRFEKEYDIAVAYNQGFATYFVNVFVSATKKYAWLNTDYKKAGYNILVDYPIYKNFNTVVAVSPEAKEGLRQELLKINKQLPITIIKDITDKKIVQEQAKHEQKVKFTESTINIVSVGRLVTYKGFKFAIEACAKLVSKGYSVNWYVVGEGNERKKLEQLIRDHQLENYFFLIGSDSNPYPYMKNATIYVQTSLFEGLGLTVIEASYLNKPIVSTNFPTAYGILEDGVTGLISEMNSQSIAAKIELLINDDDLKNNLVKNLSLKVDMAQEDSLAKIYNLFEN